MLCFCVAAPAIAEAPGRGENGVGGVVMMGMVGENAQLTPARSRRYKAGLWSTTTTISAGWWLWALADAMARMSRLHRSSV